MTVASKPVSYVSFKNKHRQIIPLIPLDHPEAPKLKKGNYMVMKCKADTDNPNSTTFDLPIPYFRSGTLEEYLK